MRSLQCFIQVLSARNLPCRRPSSCRFGYSVLPFSFSPKKGFHFLLNFSLDPFIHSIVICSVSVSLYAFCSFCCGRYLTLIHGSQIRCRVLFQFSYFCRDLLYIQVCGQFWRKFYILLKRKYILLSLGETFCKYMLGQFQKPFFFRRKPS